jgi:hypothetical protein
MPRITGTRERRHQPIYDSLLRRVGGDAASGGPAENTTIQSSTKLFGNANVGNLARTNLQVAGQLASDQTYIVMALRCFMYFVGTNAVELFQQVSSQLTFTFTLGDKPQFVAPAWYLPAGGGVYGGGGATSDAQLSNGWPSQDAILKLARPIVIPVRQNISVDAQFFSVGSTSALTTINGAAEDDQMSLIYMIDGIQTRDVQ